MDEQPPLTVGVVGSGFRAQAFLRLAQRVPAVFGVIGAVTRSSSAGAAVEDRWQVPAHRSVEELVAHRRPDLVVTAVPAAVNAEVLVTIVELGLPVLAETPPAADVEGLRRFWRSVG